MEDGGWRGGVLSTKGALGKARQMVGCEGGRFFLNGGVCCVPGHRGFLEQLVGG